MSCIFQSGVRFSAYPDAGLASLLVRWIGCQRFIYNGKVGEDHLYAAQRRLLIRSGVTDPDALKTPLDQEYSRFKSRELSPWLYDVPSQVLRNGAYRWMCAKTRQLKGLAKAPTRRTRENFNTVMLTSELFRFVRSNGEEVLEIGTEKNPVGLLGFKDHRPYGIPRTIVIRNEAGRWYVSFSYAHEGDKIVREPHEVAYEINGLDNDLLDAATIGLDRNVRDNCFTDSVGRQHKIEQINLDRIARREKGARRYQRQTSRTKEHSANRRKVAQKIARRRNYAHRVRKDFTHKTTHGLVVSEARLFVLEDLRIKGMTRKPKAKQDPVTGKWLRNGARAKAALSKKILASCWGELDRQLQYKAAWHNKLAVKVPAAYSSQECSRCGHTHPGNRDGARFACQRCGFEAHADWNAARVIKARGIRALRGGVYDAPKTRKRVAFRRKDLETGGSPGASGTPEDMSVEQTQDRLAA
ncbi:transposase [Paraburkholderia hospita]|nr:transposase [Paraburkholderia hospita]